jgi:hypothetical protein
MIHLRKSLPILPFITIGMFASVTVFAADPSPADILEGMRKAYSALLSYSDSGVVETTISMAGQQQVLKKPFVITFKKPDLIRIEWISSFGGMKDTHILWSNKNGTFIYNQLVNQVRKEQSLAQATASFAGTSGGSARTVPSLLLNVTKDPQFSDLTDLKSDGTETIGGTICHKVSGKRRGQPVILCIGEKDSFLRKMTVRAQKTTIKRVVHEKESIERTLSAKIQAISKINSALEKQVSTLQADNVHLSNNSAFKCEVEELTTMISGMEDECELKLLEKEEAEQKAVRIQYENENLKKIISQRNELLRKNGISFYSEVIENADHENEAA